MIFLRLSLSSQFMQRSRPFRLVSRYQSRAASVVRTSIVSSVGHAMSARRSGSASRGVFGKMRSVTK